MVTRPKKRFLSVLALNLTTPLFAAANTLYSSGTLQNGQSIVSTAGKYRLTMQSDGSLVMYRADGSIRYRMAKYGYIAVMQGDGNFVEYGSAWSPLWSTGTWNNPGSVLSIQDDGNLVIYSPTKGAIWSIGAEISLGDPGRPGEVVGRDLNVPGMSWAGHLGIWNGKYVVESVPPARSGENALRLTTTADFKIATRFWGVASPKIPTGAIKPFCYKQYCRSSYFYPEDYVSLEAR